MQPIVTKGNTEFDLYNLNDLTPDKFVFDKNIYTCNDKKMLISSMFFLKSKWGKAIFF